MSGRHVVLLDLDGTLIDSAPGILTGIRAAFAAVQIEPPDDDVMRGWIGPPVRETLVRELGPHGDAVVERANAAFREYFDAVGAYESVAFPGIHDALADIDRAGSVMAVVTHKPASLARIAVAQHGLDVYLQGIFAPPSPGEPVPKQHLFAEALAALMPRSIISVGDRGSDITAAALHDIEGVGVIWGYGTRDELRTAGAAVIATAPGELPGLVRAPGVG